MNTKRISAAAAAAAFVVLGSATSAFGAYEAPQISLELSAPSVTGGGSFTATATSDKPCDSWTLEFDGPTTDGPGTGAGLEAVVEFSTTTVGADETGTVTATCFFDDGSVTKASAPAQLSTSADILVTAGDIAGPTDGGGDDDFGGLASTGGPHLWLAIGGAALTLAGAGAVVRSRRATA